MIKFPKHFDLVVIAALSVFVGLFVALEWDGSFMSSISSGLFTLFLPGITFVVFLFGGFHDANEVHVVLGVLVQILVLWFLLKLLYKKCNKKALNQS